MGARKPIGSNREAAMDKIVRRVTGTDVAFSLRSMLNMKASVCTFQCTPSARSRGRSVSSLISLTAPALSVGSIVSSTRLLVDIHL